MVDGAARQLPGGEGDLVGPLGEEVRDALVRGVAPGEQLSREQQTLASLPARHLGGRETVEVDVPNPRLRFRAGLFAEAEMGGYKRSGLGRLHGPDALLDFTEQKHVYQNVGVVVRN